LPSLFGLELKGLSLSSAASTDVIDDERRPDLILLDTGNGWASHITLFPRTLVVARKLGVTMAEAKKPPKPPTRKKDGLKKACWKGYTAVGMKKKGGKMVPNCVPTKPKPKPKKK